LPFIFQLPSFVDQLADRKKYLALAGSHPIFFFQPNSVTMSRNARFSALDTFNNRGPFDLLPQETPEGPITSFYAKRVFTDEQMRKYIPESAFLSLMATRQSGVKLTREVADAVAEGMKNWAMEQDVTHYAHWFQPWTGKTAEKHDSFFNQKPDGTILEEFNASALVQQEPDGSSFPKGGLRSTFEARGYTAWDPSSPAFIISNGIDATLCIPTIFITYTGDAQDFKLPVLRSIGALEKAAMPIVKWFYPDATSVFTTLGWEQEYFLIDEAVYNARPDLVMTGRTLLGRLASKNQQLEDHYFGSIPERVYAYMRDLEIECHLLGIPVRTRHNEVAPGQYELAPVFEECNVAIDHNQLLMDVMDRVAHRHKLRVLLHEKPFAGINGSGKHNNWSMATNTGKNLLAPGDDPGQNLRFLTFFINTIKCVAQYGDMLRAAIATASNDHRLGANEAPPAIISVYIGHTLTQILSQIEKGNATGSELSRSLSLLANLPNLELDNTDRNRTSPFAFTGNKFEVRAVGSSQNCAGPMFTLNAMMAAQLIEFQADVAKQTEKGKNRDEAILSVLKRYIKETKAVRFEGDNYSQEWKEEAARRGLNNFTTTPEALESYQTDLAAKLFTKSGVLTKRELHAFYDVQLENYSLKLDIESKTLEEMCKTMVLPASMSFLTKLAENVATMKAAGLTASVYATETLNQINGLINTIQAELSKMAVARNTAAENSNPAQQATAYCQTVKPCMEVIRDAADELELLIEDGVWPIVKYREMLFIR
jgi:glutamine synthetase